MRLFWRLLGYLKPYLRRLITASILLAISGALMAVVISTVKPLVNHVLLRKPLSSVAQPDGAVGPDILQRVLELLPIKQVWSWAEANAYVQVPLLIVLIFLFRSVFLYFGQYSTIKAGAAVIRDIRNELYESIAYQSLGFFRDHPTGLIISRILNDVLRLQRVTTIVLADLVRVCAMVPFLVLVAFYHEWRMSLLAMIALPLLGYPMVRLGKRLRRASTASQESMALVANRLTESVMGVKIVQSFGMESYEIERFRDAISRMLRADLRAGRAQALAPAVMELLGAVVGGALFYFAGLHIARGNLDPGNFAVVLFCLGLLFMSQRKLNTLYAEIQNALAAAARVFDMLDRQRDITDAPEATPLPPFSENIGFRDVGFSYGEERVLDGINLTIRKGETVALVGPSGSGKTTLANLLPRFYDPTSGGIFIDGRDIRKATLSSIRSQIGLVTQETVLFDDSIRNNIAYGRSEEDLERVKEVARASQAHDFIENLPRGYETELGEFGTRLSMGQRQRITIARALLKDPPILVLDEATSALDSESELLVQKALDVLMRGRTSIVIAHRLATVRDADRILVMDSGRIIEEGSHRELLAKGGAYARLYEIQFKGVISPSSVGTESGRRRPKET
jgi:subfamily B ATP-binding cassette protein MsbA